MSQHRSSHDYAKPQNNGDMEEIPGPGVGTAEGLYSEGGDQDMDPGQ